MVNIERLELKQKALSNNAREDRMKIGLKTVGVKVPI
jgi:hypothetical protein